MCKKSTQKIKFRLVYPDHRRGRMFEATDIENLADLLTDRFGVHKRLNVFWHEKAMLVGMLGPGRLTTRWWWKESPEKFPESIVRFFDPYGFWGGYDILQYDESNQQKWWTDIYLEIIGGVK